MASLHFTEGQQQPPRNVRAPKQLLPNVVDGMANVRPEAAYALIPNSFTSYDAGYRTVTYRQLANAANGVAWLLREQLGADAESQVLAYVGPNDIGYIAFILGAVKAGHCILCLSPRNTKEDNASLFAETKCKTLLTLPQPYSPTVNLILESVNNQCRILHIPTIFQLLDGKYAHFPYPKTYNAAKDEPLAMVHTSGTTSTPKLVTYTHAFAASYNRSIQEPAPEGHVNVLPVFQSLRAFTSFPFFHGGGLMVTLMEAITNQTIQVCGLAGVAPSAARIIEALNHVEVDIVHMPAPFAEQVAKDETLLHAMTEKSRAITYGGGDVSEACANAFLAHVYVAGFIGSTETSPYPLIRPIEGWEPSDMKYFQPHPIAGLEFRATPMPDLYEAVVVRNADEEQCQPVFTIFPKLNEWRTKDLFSPHPTKPGLWRHRSRADDMIVSATGEMCNPIPLEQHICRLPEVAAALMVGTGRYQKALLVEPTDETWLASPEKQQQFVARIWPTIEAANQSYPDVSQVARSRVLLTEPGLPLRRAGKGTVQRAPSLTIYQKHIDRLYDSAGDGKEAVAAEPYKVHIAMSAAEEKAKP